jgi:hypothetical protein
MSACDISEDQDAPPRTAATKKPKQPFLKRGEGVKRRVEAYKHRKPSDIKAVTSSEQSLPDQFEQQQGASVGKAAGHRQHGTAWHSDKGASKEPYSTEEQGGYYSEQHMHTAGMDRDVAGKTAACMEHALSTCNA